MVPLSMAYYDKLAIAFKPFCKYHLAAVNRLCVRIAFCLYVNAVFEHRGIKLGVLLGSVRDCDLAVNRPQEPSLQVVKTFGSISLCFFRMPYYLEEPAGCLPQFFQHFFIRGFFFPDRRKEYLFALFLLQNRCLIHFYIFLIRLKFSSQRF